MNVILVYLKVRFIYYQIKKLISQSLVSLFHTNGVWVNWLLTLSESQLQHLRILLRFLERLIGKFFA